MTTLIDMLTESFIYALDVAAKSYGWSDKQRQAAKKMYLDSVQKIEELNDVERMVIVTNRCLKHLNEGFFADLFHSKKNATAIQLVI